MALAETPTNAGCSSDYGAGTQPVALGGLRSGAIDFPDVVLSERELDGYAIERVYDHERLIGVRLLEPEPPDTSPSRRRHRWRRALR